MENSYRTLIGQTNNRLSLKRRTYILETNDSTKFYSLVLLFDGTEQESEFIIEYLKRRFLPISDIYYGERNIDVTVFIRDALFKLFEELKVKNQFQKTASSVLLSFFQGDNLYLGTINSSAMFIVKDKKFKQVFEEKTAKGVNKQDVVAVKTVSVGDNDKLLLCSRDISRLSKLEIKNVILTENDLDTVCSKLSTSANKYGEVPDSLLTIIQFKRIKKEDKTLFTFNNVLFLSLIFFCVLGVLLGRDILEVVNKNKGPILYTKTPTVEKILTGVFSHKKTYKTELLLDQLSVPYDIADDGNNLYIIDDRESKVIKYNLETKEKTLLNSKHDLIFPTGINVKGKKLYIADFSLQVNKVYILAPSVNGGNFLGIIPDNTDSKITLNNPKAVDVDNSGNIFICDRANNRILKLSSKFSLIDKIELPEDLAVPNGIAVSGSGEVFMVSKATGNVAKILTDKTIKKFEILDDKNAAYNLMQPSGIDVDTNGNVYLSDRGNRRVIICDSFGRVVYIIDENKLPSLTNYYPMSVKISHNEKYLYIVLSMQNNYSELNKRLCKGQIWRVEL